MTDCSERADRVFVVPRHTCVLQVLLWRLIPEHGGVRQDRLRLWDPPPQLTVQADHADQSNHGPESTGDTYRQSDSIEILHTVCVTGSIGHTDSPEQLWVLQAFCCRPDPTHSLPPLWGAGLSHSRVRILAPPPHWAEQSDQGAHWPQLPSTWQPGTESHCRTPASQVLEKRIEKHTDTDIKKQL